MTSKKKTSLEAWRETLAKLAAKLPDHPLEPPVEGDIIDEDHRGSEIPDLTTSPVPE